MKHLILLVVLFSLVCISCEKEPREPDPGMEIQDGQKIAEVTIDETGGILESEEVILRVPAGALDTSLTLTLYLDEQTTSLSSNQLTRTYVLKGLNGVWGVPLEMSVKYEGELSGESYISLAYDYYDPIEEDSILVDELYEAVDSMGFLKCSIPSLEMEDNAVKSVPSHPINYHPLVFHTRLMLRGMSNMGTVKSECAEIRYDSERILDLSKVQQLATYIDEAVYFFHSMGIMSVDYFRGKHKIRVQILDNLPSLGGVIYHIENVTKADLNAMLLPFEYLPAVVLQTYLIKLEASNFYQMEDRDMKAFGASAAIRFDNTCYFGESKNWLLWAVGAWVNEYFYGSVAESIQQAVFMHPFYGMNVLNIEKYEKYFFSTKAEKMEYNHGLGISPLVKYLMETHNDDLHLLLKIYQELENPESFRQPIDAILPSIGVPEYAWWPGFTKAYLSGEVRDIPGKMFMEAIDPEDAVHFIDESDTVKYFDRLYPDLSARLCEVNLVQTMFESTLGDEDKMQFKIGPESLNMDYVKVQVFDYKDGKLEFLAEGQEVILDQLRSKMEQGTNTLLAVVVNSASESPYEEELKIDLTIRILKKRTWPWKYLAFKAVVTDAVFRSGTDEYSWTQFEFKLPDRLMNVSEDGTRFTASWLDITNDYKYEGGMDAIMDLETYCITSFHMWHSTDTYTDGLVTISEKTEILSKPDLSIPVVYWDDVFCNQQLTGQEVCEAIESFTYSHTYFPGAQNELKMNLESYSCGGDAELLFFWANKVIGLKGIE